MRAKKRQILAAFLLIVGALFASAASAQAAASDPHLAKALELRTEAIAAYDTGNYDTASELARQAKAELGLIEQAQAPAAARAAPPAVASGLAPLPATYVVRLLTEDRDSLSKIAGYPFVYGDRSKWVVLYKANRASLKHPENADLIHPNEVLVIPSISGEARAGEYDPSMEYSTVAAK